MMPEDDYDRIIVIAICAAETTDKIAFGINEIASLVEKEMSYKTALKHIHNLIDEGYLLDVNELRISYYNSIIKKVLDPATPQWKVYSTEKRIENAFGLIYEDLNELINKIKKSKKRIMIDKTIIDCSSS